MTLPCGSGPSVALDGVQAAFLVMVMEKTPRTNWRGWASANEPNHDFRNSIPMPFVKSLGGTLSPEQPEMSTRAVAVATTIIHERIFTG